MSQGTLSVDGGRSGVEDNYDVGGTDVYALEPVHILVVEFSREATPIIIVVHKLESARRIRHLACHCKRVGTRAVPKSSMDFNTLCIPAKEYGTVLRSTIYCGLCCVHSQQERSC